MADLQIFVVTSPDAMEIIGAAHKACDAINRAGMINDPRVVETRNAIINHPGWARGFAYLQGNTFVHQIDDDDLIRRNP